MRATWIVLAIASCGRFGFEPYRSADAPAPLIDAAPIVPAVVTFINATTNGGSDTATLQLQFPESNAGDLLIVAIADHKGTAVATVVDGSGRPLTSAGARAVMSGTASELWYEADAIPTDAVTVMMSSASSFDAWVAEFAGANSGPPRTIASNCLEYPPTIVTAPVTTTVANELVFSVTMAAYPLFVNQMQPPFVGKTITGNAAGYDVAAEPGMYGTTFDIAMGSGMAAMTCASTASWSPGS